MRIKEREASRACKRLLKRRVERTSYPSSRSLGSIRVFFKDGGSVIASRRDSARAQLEFEVLRRLRAHGALVPEVLAYDGNIIIQEDLGENQFSRMLRRDDPSNGEKLVDTALASLVTTHRAAKKAGLKHHVATLGEGEDWRQNVSGLPQRVGEFLNIPAPDYPISKLVERLRVVDFAFIKWDARAPNAVLLEDGNIAWIDWEHCGRRNSMDDLAWFFGDQSMPDWPDVEERLLKRYLTDFAEGWDIDDARDYLAVYGTLHICLRLTNTLYTQKRRGLKDWSSILNGDTEAKSALKSIQRMSIKASRWATRSPLTADLSPWLQEVAHQNKVPDQPEAATLESSVMA